MFSCWFRRGADVKAERWVVVDVETTGLHTDAELLAIGAVAMLSGRITPHDSLELVLTTTKRASHDNIVIHGIGVAQEQAGQEPRAALLQFVEFVGSAPVVAFHAPFDRGFITRAVRAHLGRSFPNAWLDLAELAPAVDPEGASNKSLDDWLARYGIDVSTRHNAAADALATAMLAQHLMSRSRRNGAIGFRELQRVARSARWLARRH
jgi:DNA polymerase III subunit epsilon